MASAGPAAVETGSTAEQGPGGEPPACLCLALWPEPACGRWLWPQRDLLIRVSGRGLERVPGYCFPTWQACGSVMPPPSAVCPWAVLGAGRPSRWPLPGPSRSLIGSDFSSLFCHCGFPALESVASQEGVGPALQVPFTEAPFLAQSCSQGGALRAACEWEGSQGSERPPWARAALIPCPLSRILSGPRQRVKEGAPHQAPRVGGGRLSPGTGGRGLHVGCSEP